MLLPDGKRPALISVRQGTPCAFSRRSKLNVPDARGSIARTAAVQTATTSGAATVLASCEIDDVPLGLPPPPKYDKRSHVFVSTSSPALHSAWHEKSRPGRYSDRMNDVAGTPRMSLQYAIQLRACSGRVTGSAPVEPLPLRTRHQTGARAGRRAKIVSSVRRLVTG